MLTNHRTCTSCKYDIIMTWGCMGPLSRLLLDFLFFLAWIIKLFDNLSRLICLEFIDISLGNWIRKHIESPGVSGLNDSERKKLLEDLIASTQSVIFHFNFLSLFKCNFEPCYYNCVVLFFILVLILASSYSSIYCNL